MGKKNEESNGSGDALARLITSESDQLKAQKWFQRARELGDKRQFDYAIEYYVNGLEFWPDAVEDACKAVHGCGVARRQLGGKKPGLKDTMKRSMTDKDPRKAFLNSLWLFGHDPDNYGYVEGVFRNAGKLRAEDAAMWAGGIAVKSLESTAKASSKQFQQIVRLHEELGDRAAERGERDFAVEAYQAGVNTLSIWRRRVPKDPNIEKALKDLSTKLTILKGKYEKGASYRESIADSESQQERHDRDRSMQSAERVDELITAAELKYEQDPQHPGHLTALVELLCRRELETEELKAIGLLVNHYKQTEDYRWKQQADDIRMKQLGRQTRQAAKAGHNDGLREAQVSQLRFELRVFKDRVERYPTDTRVKFEYALRCFRAGRFDDAIPLLQAARVDPKNRAACGLYLGRCFFRKGYHAQAISALQETCDAYDNVDDDLGKSLYYWLARCQQESDHKDDAKKTYGKILQLDYNYRDVRARLDGL